MPGTNRSIGGRDHEQGGPNMGNDYSRSISREHEAGNSKTEVVKNRKPHEKGGRMDKSGMRENPQQQNEPKGRQRP